ncbi:hypothetical protein [Sphingomonas sp. BK580]|uniref:hypothetical protein n=1 Tax=Sphingomonas sp. BK580 TaxID=2586972 RepID=UPI00160DB257|nr:hypothetical protein [Sphingomonas sp. BK580]
MYRPVEDAVVALRCVFALLDVVARRHGSSVVHDFRTSLQRVQEVLSASEQTEEQVEGRILGRAIAEQIDWDAIIDRASDPDHARWAKSD